MDNNVNLRDAVNLHIELTKYQDTLYLGAIKKLNTECQAVLKNDLGSNFVSSCVRDLAGEVVRNYFDTSDYYLTVDQLAERLLKFDYNDEIDPLNKNNPVKNVLNYNEISSERLDKIVSEMDSPENREKLFPKKDGRYEDDALMQKRKNEYAESKKDADGNITDEYTGHEGEYVTDKNGNRVRRQQVEHTQSTAAASYDKRYMTEKGVESLKEFLNSKDNFAMMSDTANQSKGDVRVYEENDKGEKIDITHRATPEQLTNATIERWENTKGETRQKLIEQGYLNEDGKVPKHVKNKLLNNVKHSQNKESTVILKNTDYTNVAKDAAKETAKSTGKVIAGQVIYYAAPPLIFEVKQLLKKHSSEGTESIFTRLAEAAKRIGKYVLSKLKLIFQNIVFNSLKNFVKIFMDILINIVKSTVKKMLKLVKNLVLSVVDAVKILAKKGVSRAEKADAVSKLFGVTVTTFVVDTLFNMIQSNFPLPEFLIAPLQVLATVICTNLTMVVLQKADLFNVQHGFKIAKIRELFANAQQEIDENLQIATQFTQEKVSEIIAYAKNECILIKENLYESNFFEHDITSDLKKISDMFNMNIDFEYEQKTFLGTPLLS